MRGTGCAMGVWLAALGASSALGDTGPAAAPTCEGVVAFYTPGAPAANATGGWRRNTLAWLDHVPVAFAASGDACRGPVPLYTVPVGDMAPTRDVHLMARRLAPSLRRYTRETGFEACARLCRTDDGWVVARALSARSHVSCPAPHHTCPVGSTPLPDTIHAHPAEGPFLANGVDALGWDDPGLEGQWAHAGYANRFSPQDRALAPVWLVGSEDGMLLYLDTPNGQEVERP